MCNTLFFHVQYNPGLSVHGILISIILVLTMFVFVKQILDNISELD